MAQLAPNPSRLQAGEHTTADKISMHVEPLGDEHYIKWDTAGVEWKRPGEEETIKKVSQQFMTFQDRNLQEHHHCFRGTHLKTQGCLKGSFKVKDNLPEHLAQGMFSKPGVHECMMRLSSLTPKLLPDTVSAPRGAALKVFGVEGEKLFEPDRATQDFLFNNYTVLELRTPQATHEIADALGRNWNNPDGFVDELKQRDDAEVACMGGGLPQEHMAAMTQHSQSAFRYGNYVAKFALVPTGEAQKDLKGWRVQPDDPPDVLAKTLQEFHMHNRSTWSFVVQLLQNLDEQPVEDIGIEWDSKKYPFEEVATVEFPEQDTFMPGFRNYWNDKMGSCNTWHGLKEHQPLGSANRMRRTVYAESRKHRQKMNSVDEMVEPSCLKDVPDY